MLLISSTAYSEASIDPLHQDRTFLLTAPGTVTGGNQRAPGPLETNSTATTLPQTKPTKPRNTVRYRYVGESSKFRQFGQKPGQNNPWFQNFNSQYPGRSAPMRQPPMSNPWQLGGMPSMQGMMNNAGENFTPYQANTYMKNDRLFPDFPVGIYRDTNPAAFSLPGQNNGFMPGMGRGNNGFPFSPFGMF